MKIINVGIVPPPFGGVAVHVERLVGFLEKRKIDSLVIDVSKVKKQKSNCINLSELKMLFYLLFTEKRAIVHFHIFSAKLVVLFFLISFKHRTILTFHNERFLTKLKSNGEFVYKILKMLLNHLDAFIVLNDKCKELAEQFVEDKRKIKKVSNYIRLNSVAKISDKRILQLRGKYKYIISSNAWDIQFHNGVDLYGMDILIEMMKEIVKNHDAVMIFLLPKISDESYYRKMVAKIDKYKLEENFIFLTEAINGPSLWKISDIVVRATNTDGNSISVMEAIDVGTPVLASDCVERPESVILFKNRNVNDLILKINKMLNDVSNDKKMGNITLPDVGEDILKIYNSFKN